MNLPLNIDWQQILLHLLNFIILAGGLTLLVFRPVRDFIRRRAEQLAETERSGKELLADAEKKKQEYDSLLQNAEAQIRQKQNEDHARVRQQTDEQIEHARREADRIIADAELAAQEIRATTVTDMREDISYLATAMASGILEREISPADDEKLIDSCLEQWRQQNA